MASMFRQAGFTLVEMVIVLLVTLILMGIGIAANYEIGRDQALEAASGQLVADLRRVQGLAISQGEEAWLKTAKDVAAGEHGYRIYVNGNPNPLDEIPLPEKVVFDRADLNRMVRFGSLGEPKSTTNLRILAAAPKPFYLILQSWDSNQTQRVTIQAGTGAARAE